MGAEDPVTSDQLTERLRIVARAGANATAKILAAAARRLREVGDVVIVQDPEAGLGVENLYQVRQHERRLRARPRRIRRP